MIIATNRKFFVILRLVTYEAASAHQHSRFAKQMTFALFK